MLRTELLSGLVVALALIPEAISIVGGRSAMISAATGAIALVVAPLAREHGLGHLVAAVILGGIFQVALGRPWGGQADAVRTAQRHGGLRRRPGHSDLHRAGAGALILCIVFGPWESQIPMAALVAVMILVSFGTFDWHSIAPATLKRMPAGELTVMVVTVAVVATTHNLAIGVVAGSLTGLVVFARRVAHLAQVTAVIDPDGKQVVYAVTGELFFASSNDLVYQFDYATDPDDVVIDLTDAHIWDASSVAALDAVETKYAARGKKVTIIGLNQPSAKLHGTLAGQLTGSH